MAISVLPSSPVEKILLRAMLPAVDLQAAYRLPASHYPYLERLRSERGINICVNAKAIPIRHAFRCHNTSGAVEKKAYCCKVLHLLRRSIGVLHAGRIRQRDLKRAARGDPLGDLKILRFNAGSCINFFHHT